MADYSHPIRDLDVTAYQRSEKSGVGPKWLARFYGAQNWPILFQGETEDEVVQKAEIFRSETIAKHEAAFVARQEALAKAREAKKRAAS